MAPFWKPRGEGHAFWEMMWSLGLRLTKVIRGEAGQGVS